MDKRPRNFLEVAQDMRKVRRKCGSIEECSKTERRWVEICELSERLRYIYQWPTFFKQGIKFKTPFIVNGHMFREPIDLLGQVGEDGKLITEDSHIPDELKVKQLDPEFDTSDSDTELEERRRKTPALKVPSILEKKKSKRAAYEEEEETKKEVLPDLPDPDKFDKVWILPFYAKPGAH